MRLVSNSTFLLTLASGACAFVAFVFPTMWFLILPATTGYFAITARSNSNTSAILYGALFGLFSSMGGIWWFFDTLPLSWLAVPDGPIQYFLVGVVYGISVVALALPFALLAPLIRKLPDTWYRPLLFTGIFVVLEELRMWSFALFFLAPESTLSPHFSIAGFGYVLTESALFLPIAQAGHYGLNAFLAFGATLPLTKRRTYGFLYTVVLLVALLCAHLTLWMYRAPTVSDTVRVALLSTNVPAGTFVEPYVIRGAMDQASFYEPDIMVTPEGFGLAPFLSEDARQLLYQDIFKEKDGLVISSSIVKEENGNEHAELVYETATDGVIAMQDKIFFVPIGEYLPPLLRLAISFAGKDTLRGYGSHIEHTAIPGTSVQSAVFDNVRVGALLCSELLSPTLYASMAHTKTDLLFNLANNSWFHDSHLLYARLQQLAKTHALRNRQYVLIASNGSPSYAVSAQGTIVAETAWGESTPLIVDIPR